MAPLGFLLSIVQHNKAALKVSPMLSSSLDGLGKYLPLAHTGWQNLAPSGCRTEVPISLKAVSRRSLFVSRNHFLVFAHGSFPFSKPATAGPVSHSPA